MGKKKKNGVADEEDKIEEKKSDRSRQHFIHTSIKLMGS
jgi:hypothetical protein